MYKFFYIVTMLLAATAVSFSQDMKVMVQVINNSPDPDAGNVKVYASTGIVTPAEGIAFRQATAFFEVEAMTENITINYGGQTLETNIPPMGEVVFIVQGVVAEDGFDNPYSRNIGIKLQTIFYAKTSGNFGQIYWDFMHGTTDAPALTVKEQTSGTNWVENLDYNKDAGYKSANTKTAQMYKMDIISATDNSYISSFDADLSSYTNKAMFIFTSGFLNPAKNKSGAKFGVFAALPDGTVIEFPLKTNAKPVKAVLVTPADNSTEIKLSDYVKWRKQDDANSYNLQISESNSFSPNTVDEKKISDTSYLYSNLKGLTKFYWRVQAVNSTGEGPWSETRTFTTKKLILKPVKATILSPENNAVNLSIAGKLKWKAVTDAESYIIEIATDNDFHDLILDSTDMINSEYPYYSLEYNTKYYWHVNAENESGESGWSDTWTFTTEIASDVNDMILSDEICIYPNPASDYITIQTSEVFNTSEVYNIKIFNIFGVKVMSDIIYSVTGSNRIDITGLPAGVYYIRMGDKIEKFVKM